MLFKVTHNLSKKSANIQNWFHDGGTSRRGKKTT